MIKQLLSLAAAAAISLGGNAANLSLESLNCWSAEYDPATTTITFTGDWGGAAWWLDDADYSNYTDIVVTIEPATIPAKVVAQYVEGEDSQGDFCELGATEFSVKLNPEYKNHVKQIFINGFELAGATDPTMKIISVEIVDKSGAAPNYVIWSGSQNIDYWDNGVHVSNTTMADVAKTGYLLAVSYDLLETATSGSMHLIAVMGDWTTQDLPCQKNIIEGSTGKYQEEWGDILLTDAKGVVLMTIDEATLALLKGNVQFIMITGQPDSETIKRVQIIPTDVVEYYAAGDFQAWDYENAAKFEAGENGNYTLTLTEPASEIMISTVAGDDNIFNAFALKPAKAVEAGVATALEAGAEKIALPAKGLYTITINANDKTIKIDEPTGISAIATDNSEAVYYNLQGIRVNNPIPGGVYIEKRGNKTRKLIR